MKLKKILQVIAAIGVYIILFMLMIKQVADVLDFSMMLNSSNQIIDATIRTIELSILTLILSMVIGFLIFLMTESSNVFLKTISVIYRELIMGTPLLVLVFVVVYIIGVALNMHDKMSLGFLALTLYMSPYMTNSYEGAYKTIDQNQFIVMDFYGFNLVQKYRYFILPQMIKPVMPGLINNLSGIIKGTSILSTIAITEIFYTISVISNKTYRYIEGYFILWIVYLVITIPLSLIAKYLSNKWNEEI
ncbi:MAG: ABC transporter permease subunit [Sedimentibacter sp.]